MLRGVDYHCPDLGIDFLLATQVSTERSIMQAANRVGRCIEKGGRFRLKDHVVGILDKNKN